jgi:MFS family permease
MAHVSGYDRRRRAQTMSLMTMGEDAGEIIGPVLAGFLWSTWGIAIALAVRAALAITTEIYAFFLVRTLAPPITRPAEPAVLPANHLG